jgi:hypothetical protein
MERPLRRAEIAFGKGGCIVVRFDAAVISIGYFQ